MATNDLIQAAHREMVREGFEPDFSSAALAQLTGLAPEPPTNGAIRNLEDWLWSSIDNPESRDLDQVEYAVMLPDGSTRVSIGIADVDGLVAAGSPIDRHAANNTTSVYCGVTMFPMLPERLSTDRTSLAEGQKRLAIVIELVVAADGTITHHDCYRAWITNRAKLDYPSVGAWLDGQAAPPSPVAASTALADQLRLQNRVASAMRTQRHRAGALDLETIEATPVTTDGKVTDLAVHRSNPATRLIEDFMIGANVAMAGFLERSNIASLRRIVRAPERWDRIVAIAASLGEHLPPQPDAKALADFLARRRSADPLRFPDLSLSIIKLMGPGEYAVERPGQTTDGHFGLAVQDYTHSTAPNRRFADLVTQRLLKAVLSGQTPAYSPTDLDAVAARCTKMEDAARKVERTCRKLAAAVLLSGKIGQLFDAIVTGKNQKGTFIRTLHPPAEGMVVRGDAGMDVGDRVTVELLAVDRERGFIDFGGRTDGVPGRR